MKKETKSEVIAFAVAIAVETFMFYIKYRWAYTPK